MNINPLLFNKTKNDFFCPVLRVAGSRAIPNSDLYRLLNIQALHKVNACNLLLRFSPMPSAAHSTTHGRHLWE